MKLKYVNYEILFIWPDLDPMTLLLKIDQIIVKTFPWTKIEVPTFSGSKVIICIDIHTDKTNRHDWDYYLLHTWTDQKIKCKSVQDRVQVHRQVHEILFQLSVCFLHSENLQFEINASVFGF